MQINFFPSSQLVEQVVEVPRPAKKYIPDWYKKIEVPKKDLQLSPEQGLLRGVNVKSCMPFLDALTAGYIQETSTEISFKPNENGLEFFYSTEPKPLELRDRTSVPIPGEYYPFEFTWCTPWIIQLPKGYSVLITHPFNRHDLPFQTLTGIIDSDEFHHTQFGRLPFYVKKGFQGIIPIGTPMFQAIPFKRDTWTSNTDKWSEEMMNKRHHKIRRYFLGAYKTSFWHKKEYK